ncbi:MAG: arsenate reductase (glutaredoxin) [Flavobacteriales bacterium]|jgi:arsenate reductase|nr:arsenate reductase (glutaredoxin) [Flavobacteriales bacterium]
MTKYTIYHNPRCSTSRKALALLEENGIEPKVIEYLKTPPSPKELELLVMKLGVKAEDLLRKKEPMFKKKYSKYKFNEHEWVKVMHENPTLIERPVIVKGNKAVIARPMENLTDLIG